MRNFSRIYPTFFFLGKSTLRNGCFRTSFWMVCLIWTKRRVLTKKTINKLRISIIFQIFNSQNFHNFFLKFYSQNKREIHKFIILSFLKTGLLILAFKREIYGRVYSRPWNTYFIEQLRTTASESQRSRCQMFSETCVLINFTNFMGKHLCWSLFLIRS